MPSRMDRYTNLEDNKRVNKNKSLYDEVYQDSNYTDVSSKDLGSHTQIIDINEIRKLINENNDGSKIVKERQRVVVVDDEEEPKNYDLSDLLDKYKEERIDSDNDYHSLKNTAILRNLQTELRNSEKFKEEETELKELIETITCKSELSKLNNKDLSLEMLRELKGEDTTDSLKKNELEKIPNESLDKTFYTSSLDFKKEDFDKLNNLDHEVKKNNVLIKVVLIILGIMIVIVAVMMLINFF